MSFTLTKKFNDNTFHISITKNNRYYETTLQNVTKEYYNNTLSKFNVDTVNIVDMKESLLLSYESVSIELYELVVSYVEYMELKKKLETMEKQITKVSYHELIEPIVFKHEKKNYDISIYICSTIINRDECYIEILFRLNNIHTDLYLKLLTQYNKYCNIPIPIQRGSSDMFGNVDIKRIKEILVNNDWLTTENANIGMTKEKLKNISTMICPLNINNLEKLGIRIIQPTFIRKHFDIIMIPPGKMMKVYETNNTKDYKVYHSGVYDGNIINKARMLWLGFVERQYDVPDNIYI
jgi:hypothetical protein